MGNYVLNVQSNSSDADIELIAQNFVQGHQMDSVEVEAFAHDALQFLSASEGPLNQLKDKSKFLKFIGKVTGGNNKLRDISIENIQKAQRATIKILEKMAQQQVMLMDAIKVNMQAISLLQFQNNQLREDLIRIFRDFDNRFKDAEDEILAHRYLINRHEMELALNKWSLNIRGNELHYQADSVTRILEVTLDLYKKITSFLERMNYADPKNNYRWPSDVHTYLGAALGAAGYTTNSSETHSGIIDRTITVREFVKKAWDEFYLWSKMEGYEYLRLSFPLPYISGSSLAGVILWEISHTREAIKGPEEIIINLERKYQINTSARVSWNSIAQSLLWQIKVINDKEFMDKAFSELVEDINLEYFEIGPAEQKEWLSNPNRIEDKRGRWAPYVVGKSYNLINANNIKLNLNYFFIADGNECSDIDTLCSFKGFDRNKGRITTYAINNGIGNINFETPEYFEFTKRHNINWTEWPKEKRRVALELTSIINKLNDLLEN